MRPVACDCLLINGNKVLLIKRKNEPFKGFWAIPGGRLEKGERVLDCVIREAEEETGLKVKPIKLIGIYSDPKRDPRGVVGLAFLCKSVGGDLRAGDDASEVKWFSLDSLPPLAFDHFQIIHDSLEVIKNDERSPWIR